MSAPVVVLLAAVDGIDLVVAAVIAPDAVVLDVPTRPVALPVAA